MWFDVLVYLIMLSVAPTGTLALRQSVTACAHHPGTATDQLQVEADELQARHQREEEGEVVIAADQRIPAGGSDSKH